MKRININRFYFALSLIILALVACNASSCVPELRSRSDMPLRGDRVVEYKLTSPAGDSDTKEVTNRAVLRGTGDTGVPPFALLTTQFSEQYGLKTQDVLVGDQTVLGMTKPERGIGYSRFVEYEPAAICVHDVAGKAQCGLKMRIKFMQNAVQRISDLDQWDYDAIWYYTFPAEWNGGTDYDMDYSQAKLASVSLSKISQARLAWGPVFFNWDEAVVVMDGKPTEFEWAWWRQTEDIPGEDNDLMDAVRLMAGMVKDLNTSPNPWLEFNPAGQYADSWIKYAAGDADKFLTAKRLVLNRQSSYLVHYRENREAPVQWIQVVPSYNFEFNDFDRLFTQSDFQSRLDENTGLPENIRDETVAEVEKVGCQNCPNSALEQILFYDMEGKLIYSVTLRAYVGAADTLAIFTPGEMLNWENIRAKAPTPPNKPRPIDYNKDGKELAQADQTFPTDEAWREFLAETTVWDFLSQHNIVDADLFLQFRVTDNSEWAAIPCSDGGTCGYRAVRWNLNSNYAFDGDTYRPWLITQLLGEVGIRTLGFTYNSGRYEGNGVEFALDQTVFYNQYNQGFSSPEMVFMFDARALTTPEVLDQAWTALHNAE